MVNNIWFIGGWVTPDGEQLTTVEDKTQAYLDGAIHIQPEQDYVIVSRWNKSNDAFVHEFLHMYPPPEDFKIKFVSKEPSTEEMNRIFGRSKLLNKKADPTVQQYGQPTPANPMEDKKEEEKELKIKKPILPGQPGNPPENQASNGPLVQQQSSMDKEAERTILPAEPRREGKSPYDYDPRMLNRTTPIAQPPTVEQGAAPSWVTGSKRASILDKKVAKRKVADDYGSVEDLQRFLSNFDSEAKVHFISAASTYPKIELPIYETWNNGGVPTVSLDTDQFLEYVNNLNKPRKPATPAAPTAGLRRRRDYGEKVAINRTPGAPGPDYKAVTKDKSIYNDAAPAGGVGEGPSFPQEETSAAYLRKEEARNRRQANGELAALGQRYHASMPIQEIKEILKKYRFDPEAMDGIYTGHDGKMHEQCGPKTWIAMTWHKLPRTGTWEIVAYLS